MIAQANARANGLLVNEIREHSQADSSHESIKVILNA
jgi:hypothetical protein